MGLAILEFSKWQVPLDLPFYHLEKGKSYGTCHLELSNWQVPCDLPFSYPQKGKSHWDLPFFDGTCHFFIEKMASPVASPMFKLYRDILITKIIMITVYDDVDTDDHLCNGLSPNPGTLTM